jgi:hypothetical protein
MQIMCQVVTESDKYMHLSEETPSGLRLFHDAGEFRSTLVGSRAISQNVDDGPRTSKMKRATDLGNGVSRVL